MVNIKKTIENEYGIVDFDSYQKYKDRKHETGISKEEIEKLSPDNIRSDDFWAWTEKSEFEKDAITFGMKKEHSKYDCNLRGHLLALETGCLNYFFRMVMIENSFPGRKKINVLEIGPGYGSFKNLCDVEPCVEYQGVDVHPRIPGVYKIADGDTLFPEVIKEQKFDLIYSSNVFQHLSPRQRESYFEQIDELLVPGSGIFSFNSQLFGPDIGGFACEEKKYLCHYGQYTELESFSAYKEKLERYFQILSTAFRQDYIATFHCKNKKK